MKTTQLKGLAILFVIIGHLLHYYSGVYYSLGTWGVAIFYILSGYGLTKSYQANGLDGYFQKKLSKVLVPYFIVTSLWIIIDYIFLNRTYSIDVVLLSLTGIHNTIDRSMWFITLIIISYILFYVAFKTKYKELLLFLLCLPIAFTLDGNILMFFLGVVMAKYKLPHLKLLGIMSIGIFLYSFSKETDRYIFYILTCYSFAFFMVTLYNFNLKLIEKIGQYSFELYLFEAVFINNYSILSIVDNKFIALIMYFSAIFVLSYAFKRIIGIFKIKIDGLLYKPSLVENNRRL